MATIAAAITLLAVGSGCHKGRVFIELLLDGARVEPGDIDCAQVVWFSGDGSQVIEGPLLSGESIAGGVEMIGGMPFTDLGDYVAHASVQGAIYCGVTPDITVQRAPDPIRIELTDDMAMLDECTAALPPLICP